MPKIKPMYLAWVVVIALAACTAPPPRQTTQSTASSVSVEVTVAAAADLQFAFTDLAKLYETQTGTKVKLVFGSTGQLAQQVEAGAPFDLLAAADVSYVKGLNDRG